MNDSPSAPSTQKTLRVAVLSDLHVVRNGDECDSFLIMTPTSATPNGDPYTDVIELIARDGLEADLLLCPGDLGNRADPLAIKYGWEKLHQLQHALHADALLVASGNHDLDSRRQFNTYDPSETLKTLQPRYPLASESEANRYWSHHFGAYESEMCRVIILNSAAYHWIEDEWERGRVSVRTLAELQNYLIARPPKPINILLCHHHPHRHPELRLPNSSLDVMIDGNHLIDMLSDGRFGEWFVIHGHKHHPYLSYASGSTVPPIVLSCGSFSARLYMELQTMVRNQFYIVEFPLTAIMKYGLVGRVHAWDWSYGRGWDSANNRYLPAVTPFGARESPHVYANKIASLIHPGSYSTWSELTDREPMLGFLPPEKAKSLFDILKEKYKAKIEFDGYAPVQVSRPC